MFWKRKPLQEGERELTKPREMPQLVGSHLITEVKRKPDEVWNLKCILKQVGKKEFYCRIFDIQQMAVAKVRLEAWDSLDSHPELVIWEGYYNEITNKVRQEKFVEPPVSP